MTTRKSWFNLLLLGIFLCGGCYSVFYLIFHNDFTARYQGDGEGKFSGSGFFTCVTTEYSSKTIEFQRILLTTDEVNVPKYIFIEIPPDATLGKHALTHDPYPYFGYAISLNIHRAWRREDVVSGYIILEALPRKKGQRVKGSFYVDYGNLTLEGKFNFRSNSKGKYACIR